LNDNQFEHPRQTLNDEQCELLTRKGVYPYDYVDSFEKLNEKQLPSKEAFNSTLSGGISNEHYENAQKVWKDFDMKDMIDYHNLYRFSFAC